MIYGLNFGGPDVSKAPVKFAGRVKYTGQIGRLVGVTDDDTERAAMVANATNGTRRLYVRMRTTRGVTYYAIYAA
jgi:hypothetical protein